MPNVVSLSSAVFILAVIVLLLELFDRLGGRGVQLALLCIAIGLLLHVGGL